MDEKTKLTKQKDTIQILLSLVVFVLMTIILGSFNMEIPENENYIDGLIVLVLAGSYGLAYIIRELIFKLWIKK